MNRLLVLSLIALALCGCTKEKRSNDAAIKMQDFVIELSEKAHTYDSDFIIIPQNGTELIYPETDSEMGVYIAYMNAIDALGVEEVFYNNGLSINQYRLQSLRDALPFVRIFVADYVGDDSNIPDAIQRNQTEGFVPFPRTSNNYDYVEIPDSIISENADNITQLSEVQNYLYLINPEKFASKQDYLSALSATNYDLLLIDPDYNEVPLTSTEVNSLKTKSNGGTRLVISYLNIGAAENYRYYWEDDWKLHRPGWLKKAYDGYENEIWVKFWKDEWKDIIYKKDDSYLKRIIDAGFHGVYLDNVEAYYFLYYD